MLFLFFLITTFTLNLRLKQLRFLMFFVSLYVDSRNFTLKFQIFKKENTSHLKPQTLQTKKKTMDPADQKLFDAINIPIAFKNIGSIEKCVGLIRTKGLLHAKWFQSYEQLTIKCKKGIAIEETEQNVLVAANPWMKFCLFLLYVLERNRSWSESLKTLAWAAITNSVFSRRHFDVEMIVFSRLIEMNQLNKISEKYQSAIANRDWQFSLIPGVLLMNLYDHEIQSNFCKTLCNDILLISSPSSIQFITMNESKTNENNNNTNESKNNSNSKINENKSNITINENTMNSVYSPQGGTAIANINDVNNLIPLQTSGDETKQVQEKNNNSENCSILTVLVERSDDQTKLREYQIMSKATMQIEWISQNEFKRRSPFDWNAYQYVSAESRILVKSCRCKVCRCDYNYAHAPLLQCVGCFETVHEDCLQNMGLFPKSKEVGLCLCKTCLPFSNEKCCLCMNPSSEELYSMNDLKDDEKENSDRWAHKRCFKFHNEMLLQNGARCNLCDQTRNNPYRCAAPDCDVSMHISCAPFDLGSQFLKFDSILSPGSSVWYFKCSNHQNESIAPDVLAKLVENNNNVELKNDKDVKESDEKKDQATKVWQHLLIAHRVQLWDTALRSIKNGDFKILVTDLSSKCGVFRLQKNRMIMCDDWKEKKYILNHRQDDLTIILPNGKEEYSRPDYIFTTSHQNCLESFSERFHNASDDPFNYCPLLPEAPTPNKNKRKREEQEEKARNDEIIIQKDNQNKWLEIINHRLQVLPQGKIICSKTKQSLEEIEFHIKNGIIPTENQVRLWQSDLLLPKCKESKKKHNKHKVDSAIHSQYGEAMLYQFLQANFSKYISEHKLNEDVDIVTYLTTSNIWNISSNDAAKELFQEFMNFKQVFDEMKTQEQREKFLQMKITWKEWMILAAPENRTFFVSILSSLI
jgi:hypothetical protein